MPGDRCPTDEDFEKHGFAFDKSETIEDERIAVLRADNIKLHEQLEAAAKSKEAMVMRFAMSEKDVIKLNKEVENSDKKIKMLMKELETLNQQNKQLSAERNHFAQLSESKNHAADEEKKSLRNKVEELQTEIKSLEITKSQFSADFAKEKIALQNSQADILQKNESLVTEIERLKDEVREYQEKIQESAEIHVVQKECEKLREELSSKEFLIKWTQDRVSSLETECEQLRISNAEVLNDMKTCRSKEEELLAYTQQVTEKNVSLQSKLSTVESKVAPLEEENEKLRTKLEEFSGEKKGFENTLSIEKQEFYKEKQVLQKVIEEQKTTIALLQQQLDESKGEAVLLRKKHESSLKEFSKELRRQARDAGSEVMSQSSRTSSCSSLNNIDGAKPRSPDNPNSEKLTTSAPSMNHEVEITIMPDQQALIERILKLQRMLVKKQEKIDFLQDHGGQLVDELQKKCRIIQSFALHQEAGTMSTAKSDRNKAEVVKHGGVMASLYASKQSDDGLTLDLSLEINSKLQAVLEDCLLKNITLKENVDTLGEEISRLNEVNKLLSAKLDELSRNSAR